MHRFIGKVRQVFHLRFFKLEKDWKSTDSTQYLESSRKKRHYEKWMGVGGGQTEKQQGNETNKKNNLIVLAPLHSHSLIKFSTFKSLSTYNAIPINMTKIQPILGP